jgi:DNA-binding transcriptional LysR family regulator
MYKQIKCFLEVANCLSFTVAAERIFTTQQAVTRQISSLEEELGVRLFNRTTRSVSLTEAGMICRDEFSKIMDEMDRAVKRVRSAGLADSSSVTIGFYIFFARSKIITPIMESLYEKFPKTKFNIRLYDFRVLRQKLMDGDVDICVALSSDWHYWPLVKVIPLRKQPFKVVLSHNHPLAAEKKLDINALSDYTWVAFDNLENVRPYPQPWLSKVPCKNKMPVGNFSTVLANVEAGQGFACLTPVFEGLDRKELKYYPLPFEEACADFICAYREDMLNPIVLSIAKHIQHNFNPNLEIGEI